MPESPASRLTAAATRIREVAEEAAKPENCHPYGDTSIPPTGMNQWASEMCGYLGGSWGVQAGLWSPPVALAVAEWLEAEASVTYDWFKRPRTSALAVANAVLANRETA